MKSLKTIRKLFKLGTTLSKIAFVCAVVGGCGCIAGLLSAAVGGDFAVKLQGVTIHGILDHSDGSVVVALSGWLIVCAGEAVLAGFAKSCFANAQQAGTPFTFAGVREMRRLGILTMAVPIGCAFVASVAAGLAANLMNAAENWTPDFHFADDVNIVLGLMFLLGALLCRCGAELAETNPERNAENCSGEEH